jgi:hypothetical protein
MLRIIGLGVGLYMLATCATSCYAATVSAGGVALQVDAQANVTSLSVGETQLNVSPGPLVELCDVEQGGFVAGKSTRGGIDNELMLDFSAANATAKVIVEPRGESLRFSCNLKGAELPARGMLLRFSFPFDAQGWQWHKDMQTSVPINESKVYENVQPLRAYADLPEWKDEPDLRMGYSNRNFCTVLTGPVGLCLAVPLDKPCTFRTAYDAAAERLEIVYDFALSPDTGKPNEVDVAFDLYACDPTWGFRSALARYYRMYADLFKVYIRDQGQWMAFRKLSDIDNVNEFYFALQEGAPEPAYDDKIGVLSCPYFTHAGMGATIPDYDPESDPLPSYDVQVKAMEEAFKKRTRQDGIYAQVGLHDVEGKLAVRKWAVYAHLIAQFNLDPDLPYGKWTLAQATARLEEVRQKQKAELDGFYYDGLSTGINYNPAHFKTAAAPCLWDPVAKKPFLNNFLSSCEFARAAAELLRPLGKITMMNGVGGSASFVAPWLDVFGNETGVRIPRETFNYVRSIIYHKPYMTLLKGNYEQVIGRPEMELFHKRCLAYGVFPGFFDWPPSGLGPGGCYWYHSRYYERDRDIFRKYQPLCRQLALAGWEPVTFARSSEPRVFVERFGRADDIVYLTLLNEDANPHQTTLSIDAQALNLNPATVEAVDLVTGRPLGLSIKGGALSAEIIIPSDGVMAIQLADAETAAGWRIGQAIETLDRGVLMREVDNDKPPVPVHWVPNGANYRREADGDQIRLVFSGAQTCSQWVMLFQNEPAEVTLRVRASAADLAGGKSGVDCRIAWVTKSFTHYENHSLEVPDGTYEDKMCELKIKSEHPLRAIQLIPRRAGTVQGTLKFSEISISDASRDEYAVDPTFQEWYEPVPEKMREPIARNCQGLRASLVQLQQPGVKLDSKSTRDTLFDAFGKCRNLSEYVAAEKAENGCRRVLRDIETIEQHLGFVTLRALNAPLPAIGGPVVAAPGDQVTLDFSAPKLPGIPVRTELRSGDVAIRETAGKATFTIPADAEVGSVIEVSGLMHIGETGAAATLRADHKIGVVQPLLVDLESQSADTDTGATRLRIILTNHRSRPTTARLAVTPPTGWRVTAPAGIKIGPAAQATVEAQISPTEKAAAGAVTVNVTAVAGRDSATGRLKILYIPNEANLLRNPGFEEGKTGWGWGKDTVSIVTEEAGSGKASLRIRNPVSLQSEASQSVSLNQDKPCAILVRASSKPVNVSGKPDRNYSLYVDLYYINDGGHIWGRTHSFQTGTTDWQMGELLIEPEKPIRNVNVYLLLRGHSGTAYFDDVALMEDPRRKGNIAREAEVVVDSNYSGYSPNPINDGYIEVADKHWTDQAWASEDHGREHFVELRFAQNRTVQKVVIYWSLDAGIARTSREVHLQIPEGVAWKTIKTIECDRPVPATEMVLRHPVSTNKLRLFQPANKGPNDRKGLMWVREIEIFEPQ